MSKSLIVNELSHACKRIFKSYTPSCLFLVDATHKDNLDFTANLFSYAELINHAFGTGILPLDARSVSIVSEDKDLGYKVTERLAPVLAYGRQPFAMQRLEGEHYFMSFEIMTRYEQFCPRHIANTLRDMAIERAREVGADPFDLDEAKALLLQQLANGENPHYIPRIKSEKRTPVIINCKDNIVWMKQDSNVSYAMSTFHKLMHKLPRAFEDVDYEKKTRLKDAYDLTYTTSSLSLKPYPAYSSTVLSNTTGTFNIHSVIEHLASFESDALDITYSAQLKDRENASAKTSFKDALAPFLLDVGTDTDNKFSKLLTFAEEKSMMVSEIKLELALETDHNLDAYIEEHIPNFLSEMGIGKELSAESKVSATKGNMKIDLAKSRELAVYFKAVVDAFHTQSGDESMNLIRAEQVSLELISDLTGLLLSVLSIYITLMNEINKRDADFGGFADRYERQRSEG